MTHTDAARASSIRSVLVITLLLNILVSLSKVLYGRYAGSVSIEADGYHSFFDGVSNIVGIVGLYIASHPPDPEHPYGHRKYETIFTIFIGVMMALTSLSIFKKVYDSLAGDLVSTAPYASFGVMLSTLAINLFVTFYERRKGRELGSDFLLADASHTLSDVYVTLGVIAGLVLTRLGVPMADPIAGAIVGLLVARAGYIVLREAAEVLADRSPVDTGRIRALVCGLDNVLDCHRVRTRGTDSHIFIDLHVIVRADLTVEEAHRIAHRAEDLIKTQIEGVIDVVVHVEPAGSETE